PLDDRSAWRRALFQRYVREMQNHREDVSKPNAPPQPYTLEETERYLTWLAKQLRAHSIKDFYVERMQPNWLLTPRADRRYRMTVIQLGSVIGGITLGIGGGIAVGLRAAIVLFPGRPPSIEISTQPLEALIFALAFGLSGT